MSLTRIRSAQIKLSEKFVDSHNTVDLNFSSDECKDGNDHLVFLRDGHTDLKKVNFESFLDKLAGPGLDVEHCRLRVDPLEFFLQEEYGTFKWGFDTKEKIVTLLEGSTYGAKLRNNGPLGGLDKNNFASTVDDIVIFRKKLTTQPTQLLDATVEVSGFRVGTTVEVSGFRVGTTADSNSNVISQVYLNGVMQVGKTLSSITTSVDFLFDSEFTNLSGTVESDALWDLNHGKVNYLRMYNKGAVNQKGFFIVFRTSDLNEDDTIRIIENK